MAALLHLPVGRLVAQCASRATIGAAQHRAVAAFTASAHRPAATTTALSLISTAPQATELLACYFASDLHAGDCYLLHGDVGAGKSFFCRAFIRAAAGDDRLPVPSPTFLLQNIYVEHEGERAAAVTGPLLCCQPHPGRTATLGRPPPNPVWFSCRFTDLRAHIPILSVMPCPPIHHFDLYRLTEPHDLARLDLAASFATAVSLVEWAERLGGRTPPDHLNLALAILDPAEQRRLAAAGKAAPPAGAPGEGGGDAWGEADACGDGRWRRVRLAASGVRWQARLQLLRAYLEAEGPGLGSHCPWAASRCASTSQSILWRRGLITVGGLGSLTSQLGVNRTKPFDFRLDWFYWSLEVFALLWIGAGVLLGKYHAFKLAFVGIAAYVNLALTPVIQTVLDLPSAANIDATAAGLLIVTIFNFLLIIQARDPARTTWGGRLTAFFDDSSAQPAFATDKCSHWHMNPKPNIAHRLKGCLLQLPGNACLH
eukprot:scaffold18.g1922.t1